MAIDAVNGAGQMQQMQQRKMDGSGGGQGQGGMKDIMQSLSTDDRNALKEKMSSMDQSQRAAMVSDMKTVDQSTMSDQEYTQTLLDILDQNTKKDTTSAASPLLSTYA